MILDKQRTNQMIAAKLIMYSKRRRRSRCGGNFKPLLLFGSIFFYLPLFLLSRVEGNILGNTTPSVHPTPTYLERPCQTILACSEIYPSPPSCTNILTMDTKSSLFGPPPFAFSLGLMGIAGNFTNAITYKDTHENKNLSPHDTFATQIEMVYFLFLRQTKHFTI